MIQFACDERDLVRGLEDHLERLLARVVPDGEGRLRCGVGRELLAGAALDEELAGVAVVTVHAETHRRCGAVRAIV